MHRYAQSILALSFLIAPFAAHAAAAPPVGTLSCPGGAYPISANLSFFDIGASRPVSGTTGSGAGTATKATQTVTVHASLSQFTAFFDSTSTATVYPTCVLTASAGGAAMTLTFKIVMFSSVDAMASEGNSTATGGTGHANGEAYLTTTLAFESVDVQSTGANDGGVTVTKTPPPVD